MPVRSEAPTTIPQGVDFSHLVDRSVAEGEEDEPWITAKPGWPFLLRAHPGEWEVATEGLDAPTALPVIMRQTLRVGCDGIRTIKKHEQPSEAYSKAVDDARRRGFVYLPMIVTDPEHLPPGVSPGRVQCKIKCKHPKKGAGVHYADVWDVPQRTAPGKAQRFRRDMGAFNRWRVWLVTSGVVPDIDDGTFHALAQRYHDRLRRAKNTNHTTPSAHGRVVAEHQEMVDIVDAMARPDGEQPADTRPQRGLQMTRAQLDTLATSLGVEAPEKLRNKQQVKDAIAAAREAVADD